MYMLVRAQLDGRPLADLAFCCQLEYLRRLYSKPTLTFSLAVISHYRALRAACRAAYTTTVMTRTTPTTSFATPS